MDTHTATTHRGLILDTARNLTEGDRARTYDTPEANMQAYAHLLTGYLRACNLIDLDTEITAEHAAMFMVLSKIGRTTNEMLPFHSDNYVDGSAYMAIAGEISAILREEPHHVK
jgi:hypothetical protein